ncbi:hypothetical protein AB0M12_42285 [Nocardia vinacea]|uniref:hypothetical protein n=1 Tax=Nocardia vinacea TaxID=96468 RepID=UPI0034248CC1
MAVLRWLHEDIAHADYHPGVWAEFARDEIAYPGQEPEHWQRRGQALLALGAGRVTLAACHQVDALIHGDNPSLDAVLDRLDGIALGEKPLRVAR